MELRSGARPDKVDRDRESLPILAAALQRVRHEAAELETRLRFEASAAAARDRADRGVLERRLADLRQALEAVKVVEANDRAVVGSRVTVRDPGGLSTYDLVLPGQGDPGAGRISCDSPLGRAILTSFAGQRVAVDAPAGRWTADVVAISFPADGPGTGAPSGR
jgi:transcription elongation GreA/GreB family factor